MAVEIIRPRNREEWLEVRKTGIGSSAIGTIAGVNPYESRYELYQRAKGIIPPKTENEDMIQGHELEGVVASMFARATGFEVIQRSSIDWLFRNTEKPWELASPDRTYWLDPNNKKKNPRDWKLKGILECKTTKRKDINEDNIPDYWFAQVQWQLGIGEMQEAHIAWLNKWGCEFGFKKILFNEKVFKMLEAMAEEFWFKNVKEGIEPVEMSSDDVKRVFPVEQAGTSKEANEDIIASINAYKMFKEQRDAIDEKLEDIKNRVIVELMDNEKLVSPTGEVLATFKANKPSFKVDVKALEKDNPQLVEQYKHQVAGARVLRIK